MFLLNLGTTTETKTMQLMGGNCVYEFNFTKNDYQTRVDD